MRGARRGISDSGLGVFPVKGHPEYAPLRSTETGRHSDTILKEALENALHYRSIRVISAIITGVCDPGDECENNGAKMTEKQGAKMSERK